MISVSEVSKPISKRRSASSKTTYCTELRSRFISTATWRSRPGVAMILTGQSSSDRRHVHKREQRARQDYLRSSGTGHPTPPHLQLTPSADLDSASRFRGRLRSCRQHVRLPRLASDVQAPSPPSRSEGRVPESATR